MKSILFTHNDLDGVGCAILGKLVFDNIDIVICRNPQDCTAKIMKEFSSHGFKEYDRIFVTDISFEKAIVENDKLFGVLNKKLRLFDHHATAIWLLEYFPKAVIREIDFNGKNVSGTSLFHDYLVETYKMSPRPFFVEQVRLYDTWDWKKGSSLFPRYLYLLHSAKGTSYFVDTFVERLGKRDVNELNIFNQYERDIIEYEENRNSKEIDRNLYNVVKVQTGQYSLGVINVTTGDFSALGNKICTEYGLDIAFMFNTTTGGISVRTARENLDLGALMKRANLGGGHAQAAGGNFGEEFITNMVTLVTKRLLGEDTEISSIEIPQKK